MKLTKLLLLLLLPALCFSQGRDNTLRGKIARDLYNPNGDNLISKGDSARLKATIVYVADTVSLKALNPAGVTTVVLTDKSAHGTFRYRPANSGLTPDGGTVFAAAGGGFYERLLEISNGRAYTPEMFGAIPDDNVDDSESIRKALLQIKQGGVLAFSKGEYICQSAIHQLYFDNVVFLLDDYKNATLVGNNTTLRMNNATADLLFVCYTSENITVRGINFVSNHPTVSGQNYNQAIQTFGNGNVAGLIPKNVTIEDCSFTGFSRTILLQGVTDITIRRNRFLSVNGHDAALSNDNPAVFIWGLYANGRAGNIHVYNNYCSGFTGTDINQTSSKKYMDGLVFGRADAWDIHDNEIVNCGEESILVENTGIDSTYAIIKNNIIRSPSLATGTVQGAYSIRCDATNATITGNVLYNAKHGILTFATSTDKKIENLIIEGNTAYGSNDMDYLVYVQGGNISIKNVTIVNNNLRQLSSFRNPNNLVQFVAVYTADQVSIKRNTISLSGQSITPTRAYGIVVGEDNNNANKVTNFESEDNIVTGIGTQYKLGNTNTFQTKNKFNYVTVNDLGSIAPAAGPTYAGSALIIVDFNSLGAGRGSSHEISNPDDYSPGPFPTTMMNTLAAQFPSATFAKKNFSVSGRQTPTMIASSGQVDALFAPVVYDRQIIVAGEITNHIADGGATAQQAIDSYVSYCKARRAKGFLVVATPALPRTSFFGSGMSVAEFASRRTVVNDYLKLHYLEFADVFADLNTIPGLTYPDGTHLDDAGYVKMGNFIASKVAPLLVTGFNPQSIAFLLSGTTTTPPSSTTTAPSTGTVTAGTVLLIAGTGSNGSTSITDATGKTVSRSGNPVISTAQSQYGGSSIYLDGNSFLTIPTSTDFDFGTGDFTVELFARPTELIRQFGGLISRGDETDNQWTFSYNASTATPDLFIRNNGAFDAITSSSSGLTLNAWQHVAVVSKSGVRKVYINGNNVATSSNARSMETMPTGRRINIGAFPTPNTAGSPEQERFKGYVQGIRITKGTARYDANFTPPTSY